MLQAGPVRRRAPWCRPLLTPASVAARIVRAAILPIWNAVAIAVAIDAITRAVTITVFVVATVIRNPSHAGGQKTACGEQHYSKLSHVIC